MPPGECLQSVLASCNGLPRGQAKCDILPDADFILKVYKAHKPITVATSVQASCNGQPFVEARCEILADAEAQLDGLQGAQTQQIS